MARILAMKQRRPLYIACYDISDPGRLREGLRVLRNYSTGGQKSVFECFLSDGEKSALLEEVAAVINPLEDRFLLLRLERRAAVRVLGVAEPPVDPEYIYVG